MSVKRYGCEEGGCFCEKHFEMTSGRPGGDGPIVMPDGEWVRWEDYEAMKAARDAWREEVNEYGVGVTPEGHVMTCKSVMVPRPCDCPAALDAKAGA